MAILENVLGFLRVVDAVDLLLQRNLPELLGCLSAMMGALGIERLLGLCYLVDCRSISPHNTRNRYQGTSGL